MTQITHSLLSAWQYSLMEYGDPEEFLRVLRREPTETTEAMQKGIDFENMVTAILMGREEHNGRPLNSHPWFSAALKAADRCLGGQLQLTVRKEIWVNGDAYLLKGRLDCLHAGEIIDIKYSNSYSRGKYFDSTQHPVYMELVPGAKWFTYLISNGTDVWTETYRRDETQPIGRTIAEFADWLKSRDLYSLYIEKWAV